MQFAKILKTLNVKGMARQFRAVADTASLGPDDGSIRHEEPVQFPVFD